MTTRRGRMLVPIALATMVAVMVMVAVAVDPALAQTTAAPTSDIGSNLGDLVEGWGKALLFGTGTLVGLASLFKRDVNDALKIGGIVMLLGGFIYAGPMVESIIHTLWTTLGEGD